MKNSAKKDAILVVDDSINTLEVLQRNLASEGYEVITATGVEEAINILAMKPVELVITDLKMPKVSGIDLIRHVRENFKETVIMMITGYASIEGAVEAMKIGAEEYIAKPFTDEELFSAVRRSLDKLYIRKAGNTGDRDVKKKHGIIGKSEAIKKIYNSIAKAASTSATVLITGESGTGKELVARAIHYSSPNASNPFVPVNCAGIPEGLLESELFGHVKGSFTGATETRAGFFQTAEGGTIFLDEISDTSLTMQAKLLRVLQDKQVCMVGSSKPRKVAIRIVAATNKFLLDLVEKNLFREDLYFRLNVITIHLPPLRERGNDILLIINHFAKKFAKELEKAAPKFSDAALEVLKSYHWPGNVRELENIINRLVVMIDRPFIDVPDLPSLMRVSAVRQGNLNRPLIEVEIEYIKNVLASTGGNKTKAAEILGIDRKTLREKLKKGRK